MVFLVYFPIVYRMIVYRTEAYLRGVPLQLQIQLIRVFTHKGRKGHCPDGKKGIRESPDKVGVASVWAGDV